MKHKTRIKAAIGIGALTICSVAIAAAVFEESFSSGSLAAYATGCERDEYGATVYGLDYLDETCARDVNATATSAPWSAHLSGHGSCFVSPWDGVTSTLTRSITMANGGYRLSYNARHTTGMYGCCSGGCATGGGTFVTANGVGPAAVGCGVSGSCGTCLADWNSQSACFTVTDGTANLKIGTSGGDCTNVEGWVDDIVIQPLDPVTYTFPADVTVACDASTDPSDTGEATAAGGCAAEVSFSDSTEGDCPATLSRTWTVTDSGQTITTHVQVIELGVSDTDGDGVADDADQCANTAAGAAVDANGCSAAQRDSDGDGVSDAADQCANTAAGAAVDANGCSGVQRVSGACPTGGSYKNHGAYVSCVSGAADSALAAGLLTSAQKDAIVSAAARSSIGKK